MKQIPEFVTDNENPMEALNAAERSAIWRQRLFTMAMCAMTLGGGYIGYWIGRLTAFK